MNRAAKATRVAACLYVNRKPGDDMPSKIRLVIEGFAHFVLLQGHNGESVFQDESDYSQFLSLMKKLKREIPVEVRGWCLEANAARLLLVPRTADALGLFIQELKSQYTVASNALHNRKGTVWEGVYRSSVVEPGRYCRICLRYLETLATYRGLVHRNKDYRWSSLGARLAGDDSLLDPSPEYLEHGDDEPTRRKEHLAFLAIGTTDSEAKNIETQTRRGQLIGSAKFIDEVERLTGRRVEPRGRGRPRKQEEE